MEKNKVREHLNKLDVLLHKSMDADRVPPQVLWELANDTARPFSIIFRRPWHLGEVSEVWKRKNVIPIFKMGKKEDSGNCRLVSLTSIPRNVMEKIL